LLKCVHGFGDDVGATRNVVVWIAVKNGLC
jgi:hypothetical protein